MVMKRKVNFKRGKPSEQMKVLRDAEDAILKGDKFLISHYMDALEYMNNVMRNEKAPEGVRLSAAKTIKESVESGFYQKLAEMESEQEMVATPDADNPNVVTVNFDVK